MENETVFVAMRVGVEEKQRAKDLAGKCGLSLTGLWRAMLAETELQVVVGWKPILRTSQGRENAAVVTR